MTYSALPLSRAVPPLSVLPRFWIPPDNLDFATLHFPGFDRNTTGISIDALLKATGMPSWVSRAGASRSTSKMHNSQKTLVLARKHAKKKSSGREQLILSPLTAGMKNQ
jgi:hypothetical protein